MDERSNCSPVLKGVKHSGSQTHIVLLVYTLAIRKGKIYFFWLMSHFGTAKTIRPEGG